MCFLKSLFNLPRALLHTGFLLPLSFISSTSKVWGDVSSLEMCLMSGKLSQSQPVTCAHMLEKRSDRFTCTAHANVQTRLYNICLYVK